MAIYFLAGILWAYCWAILARRLGYGSPWVIGVLMAIPGLNLAVFLVLVLSESPNERRLRPADAAEEAQPSGVVPADGPEESCLQCGAAMPPEASRCASCGWSWSAGAEG